MPRIHIPDPAGVPRTALQSGGARGGRAKKALVTNGSSALRAEYPTGVQLVGGAVCALLMFSGSTVVNEITTLRGGINLHLLTASTILVIAFAAVSGALHRGLRELPIQLWIGFAVWTAVCMPFSSWPTASAEYWKDMLPSFGVALAVCACVISAGQVRLMLFSLVLAGFVLPLTAALFGATQGSRLGIARTSLENPNEFGLRLLTCAAVMIFPLLHPNRVWRSVGAIGLLVTLTTLLRTGSRGSFVAALAAIAFLVLVVASGRSRVLLIGACLALGLVAVVVTPGATLERLVLISPDIPEYISAEEPDSELSAGETGSAMASEENRKHLAKEAVKMTLMHPVFGVGPGQFAEEYWREAKERGVHVAVRRPHNAYLQVSSETGLPGLVLWAAALLLSLRLSYRAYKAARLPPADRLLMAQSLGLFTVNLVLCVNLLFIHLLSYSDPGLLIALSVSNWVVLRRRALELGHPVSARPAPASARA